MADLSIGTAHRGGLSLIDWDYQNIPVRVPDHILSDATDQQPFPALSLIRSQDNQMRILAPRALQNAPGRRTIDAHHSLAPRG
jgi:hypothetical protein